MILYTPLLRLSSLFLEFFAVFFTFFILRKKDGTSATIYARMELLLKGQREDPKSLYDMPCYDAWRDVWSAPLVDCKYAKEGGLLKPYATILYQALWSFYRQGRLHSVLGERKGKPITKFWVD